MDVLSARTDGSDSRWTRNLSGFGGLWHGRGAGYAKRSGAYGPSYQEINARKHLEALGYVQKNGHWGYYSYGQYTLPDGSLSEPTNNGFTPLFEDGSGQNGGSPQGLQASLYPAGFEYGNTLLNAGSTLVGIGEQGLKYIRQYPNGPRDIARGVSNLIGKRVGTQVTARFLSNTFNGAKSLGSKLGWLGAVASTTDYIANFNDKNGYDHASYWIGVGVMAVSYAVPVIGITYGGAQLVSYLYNGKSLEENVGKSLGY